MDSKSRTKFSRKLLFQEISTKHKRLKVLLKEQETDANTLNTRCTWMKRKCIEYSINFVMSKFEKEVSRRHLNKYEHLVHQSNLENGISENPNSTIWNLSSRTLSNDEYEILSYD